MRLKTVHVRNYRSVKDSGEFDVDKIKTILVGPNEAGKSALLQAIQQINPPEGVPKFEALRDYPRSQYNDIDTGKVTPDKIEVVTGVFELEDGDHEDLPQGFEAVQYAFTRFLDNRATHKLVGAPSPPYYKDIKDNLLRLAAHADRNAGEAAKPETTKLQKIVAGLVDYSRLEERTSKGLNEWLDGLVPLVDEDSDKEMERLAKIREVLALAQDHANALSTLNKRLPRFVLYSNYFRVRPSLHLKHLADRLDSGVLDDKWYDYGNSCLLKLLGFSARDLSNLGNAAEPSANDAAAVRSYKDQLDKRAYKLNAASVRLTDEIKEVWRPNSKRGEAEKVLIRADGQYLKAVVEDDLGVEVELDQRSEGFQWLVSFFVVFFAEAADQNENTILLLDEPGMSLHALKQREFRSTLSRLAEKNQTLYTTHSPFLVGPNELEIVRVVEMTDRQVGTKVHTTVTSSDPAALLPLQEALGYDLAESLFMNQRNLIVEGLTDLWYLEALSEMLRDAGETSINPKISLIPSQSAGKVSYFATILHANNLKVAALLDSDAAGDQAALQEVLVHTLGNKRILRTKDYLAGGVKGPEIEDLLRGTLINVAKEELNWDIEQEASKQASRPIVNVFSDNVAEFSKYRLAKAFLRWGRSHSLADLNPDDLANAKKLVGAINAALK